MTEITNLREATELLYTINSQIISLRWIGLKQIPKKEEIELINNSIAQCIKAMRNILKGEGK